MKTRFTHQPGCKPSPCLLSGQYLCVVPYSLFCSLGQVDMNGFSTLKTSLTVNFLSFVPFLAPCVLLSLSSSSEDRKQRAAGFGWPKIDLEPDLFVPEQINERPLCVKALVNEIKPREVCCIGCYQCRRWDILLLCWLLKDFLRVVLSLKRVTAK